MTWSGGSRVRQYRGLSWARTAMRAAGAFEAADLVRAERER